MSDETKRQFQSGREVFAHYIPGYSEADVAESEEHPSATVRDGDDLGVALLSELRAHLGLPAASKSPM